MIAIIWCLKDKFCPMFNNFEKEKISLFEKYKLFNNFSYCSL